MTIKKPATVPVAGSERTVPANAIPIGDVTADDIVAVTLIRVPVETCAGFGALVEVLLRRFTPSQAATIVVAARTRLGADAQPINVARTAASMRGPRSGDTVRRGRRASASNIGVLFAGSQPSPGASRSPITRWCQAAPAR